MDVSLPGQEIVEQGLEDLAAGRLSPDALLVSMAVGRLRKLGYAVPAPHADPEMTLYHQLAERYGDGAHSKYNAYRRRLASFLRAAACVKSSTPNESEPS